MKGLAKNRYSAANQGLIHGTPYGLPSSAASSTVAIVISCALPGMAQNKKFINTNKQDQGARTTVQWCQPCTWPHWVQSAASSIVPQTTPKSKKIELHRTSGRDYIYLKELLKEFIVCISRTKKKI